MRFPKIISKKIQIFFRNFRKSTNAAACIRRYLFQRYIRGRVSNVIKLAAKEEAAEDHRILKELPKELIRKKRQQKQTEAAPSEKGYRKGQRAEA